MSDTKDASTTTMPGGPGIQVQLAFDFPSPTAIVLQLGFLGMSTYQIVLPRDLAKAYFEKMLEAMKQQESPILLVPKLPSPLEVAAATRLSRGR